MSSSHTRDGADGARVRPLGARASPRDACQARPRRLPVGGAGGQRPRRKHQLPAARTVRERPAADSTQRGRAAEACMHAAQSLHAGWGRRAPVWLHRRYRGGALEALRRRLVDKLIALVQDVRCCRRCPSWWTPTFPYFACPPSWSHPARPCIAGVFRSVGGALGHAEYEPAQAAEKERVRAPSNGVHLPHCCSPETKLRDRLSMRSVGVQRRVWCGGVHPTAGAARVTMGMRHGNAVMRAPCPGTRASLRTMGGEMVYGNGGDPVAHTTP